MYSLLIVDDDYKICMGLAKYFPWNDLGFTVVGTAYSGEEAKIFIESNEVHVVLTDIKMPGMSGIDLACYIYRNHPDIAVVAISGYADFSYAKQAMYYGVRYYVVKPTIQEEFIDVFMQLAKSLDKKKSAGPPQKELKALDTAEPGNYYDRIIAKIKNYVNENLANNTLESVASYIGMNPYYLSAFFKNHAGMKFIDYLTEARMKRAVELLKSVDNRISDIGYNVGYRNPNNFTRAFKAYYNISPSEYRAGVRPSKLYSGQEEGQ